MDRLGVAYRILRSLFWESPLDERQVLGKTPLLIGIAMELLETTKPTAAKAMDALVQAGVLHEIPGKRRDRVYAYRAYLAMLSESGRIA